jgi:hypothetical protein
MHLAMMGMWLWMATGTVMPCNQTRLSLRVYSFYSTRLPIFISLRSIRAWQVIFSMYSFLAVYIQYIHICECGKIQTVVTSCFYVAVSCVLSWQCSS